MACSLVGDEGNERVPGDTKCVDEQDLQAEFSAPSFDMLITRALVVICFAYTSNKIAHLVFDGNEAEIHILDGN